MHATLTINNQTILDDTLDEWQTKPPELFKDLINPKTKPQPWLKAALIALAESAIQDNTINIDIHTTPTGWVIAVNHPPIHGSAS